MGAKDLAFKAYFAKAEPFADVVNMAFRKFGFAVDPSRLRELDSVQVMSTPIGNCGHRPSSLRQRIHDTVKVLTLEEGGEKKVVMLGLEGQSAPERFMPLRIWQYEDHTLAFAARRLPGMGRGRPKGGMRPLPSVLMLMLYMGLGNWPGATRLSQLQRRPNGPISRCMNDIRMNVLTITEISRRPVDSFQSDIGVVANAIVHVGSPKAFARAMGRSERFRHLSCEAADLVNAYTGMNLEIPNDKEEIDMCYARKFWEQTAETRGEKRGIKIGERRSRKEGKEEGIKIGEERGRKKGKKEGRQEGKEEGIKIGEERGEKRGIKLGEKRGIKLGEKRGIKLGEKRTTEYGINALISVMQSMGATMEKMVEKLQEKYNLSRWKATSLVRKAMA